MIKCILFDLGGVLVPEAGSIIDAGIAGFLGIPLSEFEVQFNKYRIDATMGKIGLIQLYENIIKNFSLDIQPEDVVKKHIELYRETSTVRNEKIINLILKLKNRYLVACLTNTEIEIAEFNRKSGLFDYFDKVFISTDMGMMKPDEEIFITVIKELGLRAEDILFIDDKVKYTEAAERTGIQTINFQNTDEFIKLLEVRLENI